jgi:SAM-dependent methyltransferase
MIMPSPHDVYTEDGYFASRLSYDRAREGLWRVLCAYLEKDLPKDATLLELGGGSCHFINNVKAREKHVVDLFPALASNVGPGVTAHIQSCTNLDNFLEGSFDAVFASNLFEHLTRDEMTATLASTRRVLRENGKLLVIQPNFKYSYRSYFDDYTHVQIFTEASLRDLLAASGFQIEKVVARFLPFSLKSSGPKWRWLFRLYLALPFRLFAGQMYIVARKGGRTNV